MSNAEDYLKKHVKDILQPLIKKILDRKINNDLIISSHTDIDELKAFLMKKKYKIIKEEKVIEKKEYTIIYAKTV